MVKVTEIQHWFSEMAFKYGAKLLIATLILLLGLLLIRFLMKLFDRVIAKQQLDESLQKFSRNMLALILKVLLVATVISMMGIEVTSFIAILGALSLAVGLALSGTLQNFSGGMMLLVFKPFKVGDFIEAQGHSGVVNDVQIFSTVLKSPDNKTIIIPNGGLSSSAIINYSTESQRRIDLIFGISYKDNIDKTRETLLQIISEEARILQSPEPFIAVAELADNSVNITCRVWVYSSNYWDIYFQLQELVKKKFDEEGISIPFPQRDIHNYNSN